jgi:hypothetical protein
MALKPTQIVKFDDINMKCVSIANQGQVLFFNGTAGQVRRYNTGTTEFTDATVSGVKVAGIALQSIVLKGLPEHQVLMGQDTGTVDQPLLSHQRNETHVSGVCRLLKIGQIDTNWIDMTDNFVPGDKLYVTASGKLSRLQGNSGCEKVGHVIAGKDSDLYIRAFINID